MHSINAVILNYLGKAESNFYSKRFIDLFDPCQSFGCHSGHRPYQLIWQCAHIIHSKNGPHSTLFVNVRAAFGRLQCRPNWRTAS